MGKNALFAVTLPDGTSFVLLWGFCGKFTGFTHWLVGFPHGKPKEALEGLDLGEFWVPFSVPHPLLRVLCSLAEQEGWKRLVPGAPAFLKAAGTSRHLIAAAGAGPGVRSAQTCQDIKLEEVQTAAWRI